MFWCRAGLLEESVLHEKRALRQGARKVAVLRAVDLGAPVVEVGVQDVPDCLSAVRSPSPRRPSPLGTLSGFVAAVDNAAI
eukprot:CAMPEP_0180374498 /NCGR_PEP_ID=MMETSP0989-20121125/22031_1 /TAXON_ID=697907 /ORGANISM="non described non described, Strain CCMP2293" /LENGTH=80 /DNA_ID=CAMNT_0022371885 /DNA_START=308 /DNA_END=548 /DNA_ORIENTATION=+